jgi:hypothetical protein
MLVLQNFMGSGSYTETCHDGNHLIDIKVKDATDIQEDDHSVLIKAEKQVYLCIPYWHILQIY